MPDRIIRTVHGPTGGLLVVIGVYLAGLGIQWLASPSSSRAAGVEWINKNPHVPVDGLTSDHVAWWWIIGGAITLIGGLASNQPFAERAAIAAGIFFPAIVAALFVGAWIDGSASHGITTAWSYTLPSVIVAWQVSRERKRVETGEHIHTSTMPCVKE